MLESKRSYQRGQGNLVPSDNASSIPEGQVISKAQEKPWYIQHFTKLLIGFGLGGGAVAILLPWMLWLLCGMSSGSSDQLRLHLLYVTGGIIAVLTLLQTNWKNQGDRLKIDADIKKNEQDAKNEAAKREQDAVKSERDHIRQVHAERRGRYTKAVEQLADEKAAIRLGGIYTLVGLVDEWLADDTLKPEEQQKEGQVIINNLCAYIRSPFPLLEKKDKNDTEKSQIYEEQKIRQSILKEFSSRIKYIPAANNLPINNLWQKLTYDFSDSKFFYEVDFSNAYFKGKTSFSNTTFAEDAVFNESFFLCPAQFNGSKFTKNLNFNKSTFVDDADFSKVDFNECINFSEITFNKHADFRDSAFHNRDKEADFSRANFNGIADFAVVRFKGKAALQS